MLDYQSLQDRRSGWYQRHTRSSVVCKKCQVKLTDVYFQLGKGGRILCSVCFCKLTKIEQSEQIQAISFPGVKGIEVLLPPQIHEDLQVVFKSQDHKPDPESEPFPEQTHEDDQSHEKAAEEEIGAEVAFETALSRRIGPMSRESAAVWDQTIATRLSNHISRCQNERSVIKQHNDSRQKISGRWNKPYRGDNMGGIIPYDFKEFTVVAYYHRWIWPQYDEYHVVISYEKNGNLHFINVGMELVVEGREKLHLHLSDTMMGNKVANRYSFKTEEIRRGILDHSKAMRRKFNMDDE